MKISALEEGMKLMEGVQADYQEVIRYAVLVLQQSLSRLTPNNHYTYSHIVVRSYHFHVRSHHFQCQTTSCKHI